MSEGIGWLPVAAREELEEEQEKASIREADRLLALDPRERVLALLDRLACRSAEASDCPRLRPEDLRRVLESIPGATPLDAARLAQDYPALVLEVA